jgi:hypothetical protein
VPWTTPRTWNTGEIVTTPTLNRHIRDNMRGRDRRGKHQHRVHNNLPPYLVAGIWVVKY